MYIDIIWHMIAERVWYIKKVCNLTTHYVINVLIENGKINSVGKS